MDHIEERKLAHATTMILFTFLSALSAAATTIAPLIIHA